ncbi:glycolate oxidase subunit GlcF [Granulosicoccus antarcticus]|uniref:Glycolate oxidase iron-sulfur subunit n=1 Tax=Granulosicoccus antarcticus IMCC3135 TaxID=1192854 RepID=A0A2Z2P0I1_9GAMM|nr:glycolate oxidase subunit GlcF [Granulosicoccus antarcticus]ASJ72964.1 Lactate utilization protein A [Granulosicoccus antarcticus IMCC3135]
MQTTISESLASDPRAIAAEVVLRKCVHCGFCLATCPTYNLLGDELDSPRGRIYLIKQVVEGHTPTASTRTHLDRCLTCRSCETTCPSGVEYGHLVDLGRSLVEEMVPRSGSDYWKRKAILSVLPYSIRVKPLVKLGQALRPVLPQSLASSVPPRQQIKALPSRTQARQMLVLDGCVQPSMAPATNISAARVLDAFGITLKNAEKSGCCGAVHYHLNEQEKAKQLIRQNIDAWWPSVTAGCEAIITTASGCGVMVKDYGHILADDPDYAQKAQTISELSKDIVEVMVEVLEKEDLSGFRERAAAMGKVAFHSPCTLQHGQKLPLVTESLLGRFGFNLSFVNDAHICCGSAGTYSIFQPELSHQLRDNKLKSLLADEPDIIATANIGCQLHLQGGSGRSVVHWVELIDQLVNEETV